MDTIAQDPMLTLMIITLIEVVIGIIVHIIIRLGVIARVGTHQAPMIVIIIQVITIVINLTNNYL